MSIDHNDHSSPATLELAATSAPITVEVPDITRSTMEDAVRKLRGRRLVAGTIAEEPRCDSFGRVVSQNPGEKTRVPQGSPVDFTMSSAGPDPAVVPDVRRLTREAAESRVRSARLSVAPRTTPYETDGLPAGSVVDIRPKAGTTMAPNCPVVLSIAVPLPRFPVPNYVGRTVAAAKETLGTGILGGAFATFRLGSLRTAEGGEVPKGEDTLWVVTAQSPRENESWPRGTSIDLTVRRARGIDSAPPSIYRAPIPPRAPIRGPSPVIK